MGEEYNFKVKSSLGVVAKVCAQEGDVCIIEVVDIHQCQLVQAVADFPVKVGENVELEYSFIGSNVNGKIMGELKISAKQHQYSHPLFPSNPEPGVLLR